MLHIVQVVMWGVAEAPQLFVDEGAARAAYVECARKHWGQRYAAYCEHRGAHSDSFASAQAFVNTIDVSEKSTINYWTFDPEETGLGKYPQEEVAKGIVAVKERLARLLDEVSKLADAFAPTDVAPVEVLTVEEPETALSPSALPQEEPESDPEKYTTPEWRTFVATITRLCCGSRNDFYLLTKDDWRQDVYSNRTSLEYWDWVADRITRYKKKAKSAGYSVIEDADTPGGYRFANREGIGSEDSYGSEWEAWCAAGLHLATNRRVG